MYFCTSSTYKKSSICFATADEPEGGTLGRFSLEKGTPYVTVELNGRNYEGVMIEMKEEAGNRTMCFTAAGDNNETILGVHYFKQEDK